MISRLLTDDENFLAFQERWETYPDADKDLLEIDPDILPICLDINKTPGLVTIYANITRPDADAPVFTLALAVIEEGVDQLVDLYCHIQDFSKDPEQTILRSQANLNFHKNRASWRTNVWYNSVSIKVTVRTMELRDSFIKHVADYLSVIHKGRGAYRSKREITDNRWAH